MRLHKLTITNAALVAALLVSSWASADAPPGPFFQGFETNTSGWFPFIGSTITRVPSGFTPAGSDPYAPGIASASGSYHARLGLGNDIGCQSGGGPQMWLPGPFTRWGGYSSIFPPGGYQTRVDIYLDVPYAQSHFDTRFDWSSAINMPDGSFRRDFVFNVGTDTLGFVITGGNNATRCGADPYSTDPTHAPQIHITQSGWYTFEHSFTGVTGSPLVVIMTITQKSTNIVMGSWTRSDATDIIGVTVGGNRYGWFVQNEFDGLAIDNSERTGIVSTPGCEVKISDGGWIMALNGDVATFGGNAKVSLSGISSGQQEYHDHGPIQPLTVNTIDVQAVVCSDDRTQASLFGHTTVNGSGSHEYQIDLKDAGEPGTNDMYGILVPDVPYASGMQKLGGGNVQIR